MIARYYCEQFLILALHSHLWGAHHLRALYRRGSKYQFTRAAPRAQYSAAGCKYLVHHEIGLSLLNSWWISYEVIYRKIDFVFARLAKCGAANYLLINSIGILHMTDLITGEMALVYSNFNGIDGANGQSTKICKIAEEKEPNTC